MCRSNKDRVHDLEELGDIYHWADIQEHHWTGPFIRQQMLASTISAYSGASFYGNGYDEVDVLYNAG